MFLELPKASPYADPWCESFEARLRILISRDQRIAYYYDRPDNSTFRYRCYNMVQAINATAPAASAAWFCAEDEERLGRVAAVIDVLVVARVQYSCTVASLIRKARANGARILFDLDDLVYDTRYAELLMRSLGQSLGLDGPWDSWFAYLGRIGAALRLCDGVITTNEFLASRIQDDTGLPAFVVPNFINREQMSVSDAVAVAKIAAGWRRDDRIHVGYFSGSPTHSVDFGIIAPTLASILDSDSRVVLRVAGIIEPSPILAAYMDRVESHPFCNFIDLQILVGSTEINVVPLQNNVFTNSKSELKFFEAAAAATVTIASPTATYRNAIKQGHTGFLASEHEWGDKIRAAISILDGGHYPEMALAARSYALERFSWTSQWPAIERAISGAGARPMPRRESSGRSRQVTRRPEPAPRQEVILGLLDASGHGLEIGPSYNPLFPKSSGYNVRSLDYIDRDGLLAKYAGNPAVDVSRIELVDYVTGGRSLVETVGRSCVFDFIVASHVVEHTPDLIGFLQDCAKLLKTGGKLVLAVPDKRFCFDLIQPLTLLGDVLEAHEERRARPKPGTVFNSIAYDVLRGGRTGWSRDETETPTLAGTLVAAKDFAATVRDSGAYVDVHTWRFVPSSFRLLMDDLFTLGMSSLREERFVGDRVAEFFVTLSAEGRGSGLDRNELAAWIAEELTQQRD